MSDTDQLETALGSVRALIEADGGGLDVVTYAEGTATLQLVLADAECADCVMPRAFLETVALDMVKSEMPSLKSIVINDPREAST